MTLRNAGFTIVELLIVIVVIAILAAITVAAYNGIQTRSKIAKDVSITKQYAKGLFSYKTTNGTYPLSSPVCLGPADNGVVPCGNITTSAPTCFSTGSSNNSSALATALLMSMNSLPAYSGLRGSCSGSEYTGAVYEAYTPGSTARIRLFIPSTETCPNLVGTSPTQTIQESITFCNYNLS